jgi:tol-pal system protein YbgF
MNNSQRIIKVGAALAAALWLSGSAVAQTAGAPVYDVNNNDVEARLSVLERQVKNRTEMQHRLQQQIDSMQNELDEIRGAVEVHTNQLQKVLERQRELYLEIDKRVEALKQSGSIGGTSSSVQQTATVTPPSNSGGEGQSTQSESQAYEKAVNLILKSREYDKAIPEFQSFLNRYPDSQYAANAHYWLGQLLFNKQQWSDAATQFELVVSKFPDSTKRADALLKLGVVAEKVGNNGRAKELFQQVVSEYPTSSARKLAESRL